MCKITLTEMKILVNLRNAEPKLVASKLSMTEGTLHYHLSRIRTKREDAQDVLEKTDPYKKVLYKKRRGE